MSRNTAQMGQQRAVESPPVRAAGDLGRAGTRSQGHTRAFPRRRFRLAVIGLLAVGLCSLAVAAALSTGGRTASTGGEWSAWSPPSGGLTGAQEIADFVAPYYRASPSQQLAVVTAVNLTDPNNPLTVVVPSSGSSGGLVPLNAGSTIVYNLCGVGSHDCSIGVGQPSAARLLLLRREALELALYTFKYLSGVNTVVAILPPGHQVQGCVGICPRPASPRNQKVTPVNLAVAFDHSELAPWLERPLRQTLPEALPPTVSQMPSAPEAELVSILTAHGLFAEHTEQAQDGANVIVLQPQSPQ
ncbi:MAG TPA: hypothetical protein VE983_08250 [Solirubrobacteraceae bacterium]|nr:hypothetical protein [Solirubrobacteraceae bacterium]